LSAIPGAKLIPVDREQVPDFQTEDEEDKFRSTHELGPAMVEEMRRPHEIDEILPAARESSILQRHSRNLSVRFDLDTLNRLRKVAKKKGVGYQTLLKQFVTERLYEEEKREGLIEDREAVATPPAMLQTGLLSSR
jgi:hypothetical protein